MSILDTTPRRVLREAHRRGVHTDCLVSGWENACEPCIDLVEDVYRDLYRAVDAVDLIQQVRQDLAEDKRNSE